MVHQGPASTDVRPYDRALLGLLALSLTFNLLIAYRFVGSSPVSPQAGPNSLSARDIGSTLPPLDVERLDGTGGRDTIAFGGDARPTLIYVFTPSCQWCGKNEQNIRTLSAQLKNSHRVIGLSLDANSTTVGDYVRDKGIDFPVYIRPSAATIAAYKLGATPQTLVVDPSGELRRSWVGAYAGTVGQEIEGLFNVSLPGLVR